MKRLFFSLIAMIIATVSMAQSQTVTILRGEEIKTFFGLSSFVSAMNEAQDGDIITLSTGQFKSANISKAITLRGAGMVEYNDGLVDYLPTIIDGDISISIDETSEKKLSIEGIKFTSNVWCGSDGKLQSPTFINCNFNNIRNSNTNAKIINANLIHCRVSGEFRIGDNSTVTCINSVIRRPYSSANKETSSFEFVNCVLTQVIPNYTTGYYSGSGTNWYLNYSKFKNCYIYVDTSYEYYTPFAASSLVTNCYSNYADMFRYISNNTNKILAPNRMFESYSGGKWTDSQKFQLSDEARTTYLGDDGTQIGIYGGNIPYQERLNMPRIKKCNVAGRTTVDGKLSVEIQVETTK